MGLVSSSQQSVEHREMLHGENKETGLRYRSENSEQGNGLDDAIASMSFLR